MAQLKISHCACAGNVSLLQGLFHHGDERSLFVQVGSSPEKAGTESCRPFSSVKNRPLYLLCLCPQLTRAHVVNMCIGSSSSSSSSSSLTCWPCARVERSGRSATSPCCCPVGGLTLRHGVLLIAAVSTLLSAAAFVLTTLLALGLLDFSYEKLVTKPLVFQLHQLVLGIVLGHSVLLDVDFLLVICLVFQFFPILGVFVLYAVELVLHLVPTSYKYDRIVKDNHGDGQAGPFDRVDEEVSGPDKFPAFSFGIDSNIKNEWFNLFPPLSMFGGLFLAIALGKAMLYCQIIWLILTFVLNSRSFGLRMGSSLRLLSKPQIRQHSVQQAPSKSQRIEPTRKLRI